MRGVALCGVVPVMSVEAEEELDAAHGVGLRTVHVSEEEVAELHRVDPCEEEAKV